TRDRPRRGPALRSASMSATVTSWPSRARPAAVTRPTWPAPIRKRCIEAPEGRWRAGAFYRRGLGRPGGWPGRTPPAPRAVRAGRARARGLPRPVGFAAAVKIAFVAANTFQYDARQLRAAT